MISKLSLSPTCFNFINPGNLNIHLKRWHHGVKQIPLGSTPTFKVNKTNIGANGENGGAEFKIFYFTVPVSKKNTKNKKDKADNKKNDNTNNNDENSSATVLSKNITECKSDEPSTGGVFSKFKAEKPKRTTAAVVCDNNDLFLPEEMPVQGLPPAISSEEELGNGQHRLMYLPFNLEMLGSEYCVTNVGDENSYGPTTSQQVINQTVITSITNNNLPRDNDTSGGNSATNSCLPMYTEVIDHVGSNSYLNKSDSLRTTPHHTENELPSTEHTVGHNSVVMTMPPLDADVFTINDNSNKELSTMNVEELFRTNLDVAEDDTVNSETFLDFSGGKDTSIHINSMDCCSIPNDVHTLNWLHNHHLPSLDTSVPMSSSKQQSFNPIPTVLKNVSGGEIRDFDALDLTSYPRNF